jgi:hypothetical protein
MASQLQANDKVDILCLQIEEQLQIAELAVQHEWSFADHGLEDGEGLIVVEVTKAFFLGDRL